MTCCDLVMIEACLILTQFELLLNKLSIMYNEAAKEC